MLIAFFYSFFKLTGLWLTKKKKELFICSHFYWLLFFLLFAVISFLLSFFCSIFITNCFSLFCFYNQFPSFLYLIHLTKAEECFHLKHKKHYSLKEKYKKKKDLILEFWKTIQLSYFLNLKKIFTVLILTFLWSIFITSHIFSLSSCEQWIYTNKLFKFPLH